MKADAVLLSAPEMKANCMCGGPLFLVKNLEELQAAETLGAVGVGIHPDVGNREEALEMLIKHCTVNMICDAASVSYFKSTIQSMYPGSDADRFVIWGNLSDESLKYQQTLLIEVENLSQASQAIEQGAHMLIVTQFELLSEVQELVAKSHKPIPIFFNTSDLNLQAKALEKGIDGMVFDHIPAEKDFNTLLHHSFQEGEVQKREWIIGILALQGDYLYHQQLINFVLKEHKLKGRVVLVRSASQIRSLDGLCLPGGWSNLQSRYYAMSGIDKEIIHFARLGKPILAVCAGMILAASTPGKGCEGRKMMGLVQGKIENNVLDGVQEVIDLRKGKCFLSIFSDGPIISDISPEAEILSEVPGKGIVTIKDKNVIATTLHTHGVHDLFIEDVEEYHAERFSAPATPRLQKSHQSA